MVGFVMSSKGLLQEEVDLPKVSTEDGFDPNAYKLLKKSGYDFNGPVPLGVSLKLSPMASMRHKRGYKSKEVPWQFQR